MTDCCGARVVQYSSPKITCQWDLDYCVSYVCE